MPVLHMSETEHRHRLYGSAFLFLRKLFVAHVSAGGRVFPRPSAVDKGKVRTIAAATGPEICI